MMYNRCLEKERVGVRVGVTILATFLINIFFLVLYLNVQPSCPQTRMDRLSRVNDQRVSV